MGTPLCKNNNQNPNKDGTCTLAAIPDGCNDVNECTNTPGICGPGTCTNTPDSYSCTCQPGYTFNGTTCVDIDEVCEELDDCSADELNTCLGASVCVKTADGHACICETGYEYDGATCVDIDECADATLNTCDENAICTNTAGSHSCACPQGFLGDGQTCTKQETPGPDVEEPGIDKPDEPRFGPIMGGGIACSYTPNPLHPTVPTAIALGLAGLFMIKRRRT